MINLIELLKTETESLKVEFIQRTREWATEEYKSNLVLSKLSTVEIGETVLGFETYFHKNSFSTGGGFKQFSDINDVSFYNTRESVTLDNLINKINRIARKSCDDFVKDEVVKAIKKYESSIEKLANRIIKKKLNLENLKAETSHIDVNISTTLTDGDKTVRAYTIIAGGAIQKPHYRYLVK